MTQRVRTRHSQMTMASVSAAFTPRPHRYTRPIDRGGHMLLASVNPSHDRALRWARGCPFNPETSG